MNKKIISTLLISFILALISFGAAFQSNVLFDAAVRSLIVFAAAFVILNLCISVIRAISSPKEALEGDQNHENQQQASVEAASQDDESFKGGHINLQTPDEDDFHPLKPEQLIKHDD